MEKLMNVLKVAGVAALLLVLALSLSFVVYKRSTHNTYRLVTLEDASTISLNLPITGEIMSQIQLEVIEKDRALAPGKPLYLFINSPGGEVESGMKFIAMLYGTKREVITINQFSASMAFIIAQFLNDRYMTLFGTMMSHPISLEGLGGQIPGSLVSRFNFLNNESDGIDKVVSDRAGMDLDRYKQEILSEVWLHSEDAVARRFADEIVLVKCGESTKGTYSRTVSVFGMQLAVEFSKCPLLSEPLSVKVLNPPNRSGSSATNRHFSRETIVNEILQSFKKKRNDKLYYFYE